MMSLPPLEDLFPARRKVFVSYHHGNDLPYYIQFSAIFHDDFEAVQDGSVDREIESEDAEYVMRTIRENYIHGTSCTVVLCGAETRWRKYVDWEIKATLDKGHGLIGAILPSNPYRQVPERLQANVNSEYGLLIDWEQLTASPHALRFFIEVANRKANLTRIATPQRPLRRRNGVLPFQAPPSF